MRISATFNRGRFFFMKRLAADGMMYKGNRTMRSSFGVIDGVVVLIVITPCPPHQLRQYFCKWKAIGKLSSRFSSSNSSSES